MKRLSPSFWQTTILLMLIGGVLFLALGGYLGSILRIALDPFVGVQQWLSSRYLAISEFVTVPRDVASLRQRNAELENKVASLETQIVQLQQQLREAQIADALLEHAVRLDENRPADDISVLVLQVVPRNGDNVRRMSVRLPLDRFKT